MTGEEKMMDVVRDGQLEAVDMAGEADILLERAACVQEDVASLFDPQQPNVTAFLVEYGRIQTCCGIVFDYIRRTQDVLRDFANQRRAGMEDE